MPTPHACPPPLVAALPCSEDKEAPKTLASFFRSSPLAFPLETLAELQVHHERRSPPSRSPSPPTAPDHADTAKRCAVLPFSPTPKESSWDARVQRIRPRPFRLWPPPPRRHAPPSRLPEPERDTSPSSTSSTPSPRTGAAQERGAGAAGRRRHLRPSVRSAPPPVFFLFPSQRPRPRAVPFANDLSVSTASSPFLLLLVCFRSWTFSSCTWPAAMAASSSRLCTRARTHTHHPTPPGREHAAHTPAHEFLAAGGTHQPHCAVDLVVVVLCTGT